MAARSHRNRGVAMLLVIIALVVGFVLAGTFITSQSSSVQIARNIDHHLVSRMVAESGLSAAIEHVKTSDTWRASYANGAWSVAQSFGGGTFQVMFEDPDGSLSDDETDDVTITSRGVFEGVAHRVSAVVRLDKTMVVRKTVALDRIEVKGNGVVDSWNSAEGSYAATKGAAAMIATNSHKKEKIKIKDTGVVNGNAFVGVGGDPNVGIKIEKKGVLTGERGTLDYRQTVPSVDLPDLGGSIGDVNYSTGVNTISGDLHVDKFEVSGLGIIEIDGHVTIYAEGEVKFKDNAELRLTPGSSVDFVISDKKVQFEKNTLINVTGQDPTAVVFYSINRKGKIEFKDDSIVYATVIAPLSEVKVKDRSELFGNFVGKKFKVEKDGMFHQDLRPVTVKAGTTVVDTGGADYGVAAEYKIELKDDSRIVSATGDTARVSVNSFDREKVKVKDDAQIVGEVYTLTGGAGDTVKIEGGTVTGGVYESDLSVTVDADTPPDTTSSGADASVASSVTIDSDLHVKKLEIKDAAVVTISGHRTLVVDEDFKMSDTSKIVIDPESSLTLFVGKKLEVGSEAQINVGGEFEDVSIHMLGSDDIVLKDNAKVVAEAMSPLGKFTANGSAEFYGTVRALEVKLEGSSTVFAYTQQGIGYLDPVEAMKVQWTETE